MDGRLSMVQLVNNRSPQSTVVTSVTAVNSLQTAVADDRSCPANVKREIENEERPSSCKKAKFMSPYQQQQWSAVSSAAHSQSAYFNPLDEPSPLGLRLRKTPSLLDLIQMKLSQGDPICSGDTNSLKQDVGKRKDSRSAAAQASADKLKASNFPVSILRIGTWECISRYEGDLVAKCYFAKHKLVWEVLDGGLKSKIEIQWSDIIALKASCPENEPGVLDIEVSRSPLFFRETNPQPRKHTLWQATSDFTGGQATVCKRHFLQCPQGLLNKHYEKLIQCDPRLNLLSKKSVISRDSPYFDSRSAAFQDQDEQASYRTIQEDKSHLLPQLDHLRNEYLTPFPGFQDAAPPVAQTVVPKCEPLDPEDRMLEATSKETPSPSSVMDSRAIEENGNSDNDELNMKGATQWEQLRFSVPLSDFLDQGSGMALSTSMSTLVNQIGLCFQEQRRSCNSLSTGEGTWSSNKKMLDEIAQHLLGDSLLSANSDEQSIIARVNSLCSLLQKDVSTVHASQPNTGNAEESVTGCGLGRLNQGEDGKVEDEADDKRAAISTKGDHDPVYLIESSAVDCKPVIPRKESSGDLLLHLPRIASLPQFFVHASDELVMRNEPHGTVGGNRFR